MKRSKHGNYHKVVAFVLIAIVIISAVGFVANGWQPIINSGADSDDADKNSGDVADKDSESPGTGEIPVVVAPKYYSYLTGLEATEDISRRVPIVFFTDSNAPLYGASSSSLMIEIPTEEASRIVIYSETATDLGKIGPLLSSRDYINDILSHFGGTVLAMGNDDVVDYASKEFTGAYIDLTRLSGYHYTEMTSAFTNGDLVQAAIKSNDVSNELKESPRLPFAFIDVNCEKLRFNQEAGKITIPFTDNARSELIYDTATEKYIYYKNGIEKIDMLNASSIEFDNALILFTDSVTHETSSGTELILKTSGSGSGYYITNGTYKLITWRCDGDALTLYDDNENKLTVNRGTTYISYVKSTKANLVSFS